MDLYWPWWIPVQELRYLEARLVDSIFGLDPAVILEIEWMSQVLLMVDIVNSGNLAKITACGHLRTAMCTQSGEELLLSLASRHWQHRAQDGKMKQLEEFLKACVSGPQAPQSIVAKVSSGAL